MRLNFVQLELDRTRRVSVVDASTFWLYLVWSWPWRLAFWPHLLRIPEPPTTHWYQL